MRAISHSRDRPRSAEIVARLLLVVDGHVHDGDGADLADGGQRGVDRLGRPGHAHGALLPARPLRARVYRVLVEQPLLPKRGGK